MIRRCLGRASRYLAPWGKAFTDLSGTRTQVVIVVVGMWMLVVWKTYTLIRTAEQGMALLGVMDNIVIAAFTAWLAAKVNETVREIKTNGKTNGGGSK